MRVIEIPTSQKEEMIDITDHVKKTAADSSIREGICVVFVPHTTAGVTINENADPAVKSDILMVLRDLVPDSMPFHHSEGNSHAHVKSSLVGSSVTVPLEGGRLSLGTWQGICFCEFDGPRRRRLYIQILGDV